MTEYGGTHKRQLTQPDYHVEERKAARKKVLEAVRQRRREHDKRLMEKKRKLQGSGKVMEQEFCTKLYLK